MASGNPVGSSAGSAESAPSRLTFAQSFNSIGVFLMVYGGAAFLLGDSKPIDPETSTEAQIQAYRVAKGASIGQAYMWLGVLMLAIAALFWTFRSALDHAKAEDVKVAGTWGLLTHNRRVQFGALCIFTFVGVGVAIGSNLIAYLGQDSVMGLGLEAAGKLVTIYWLGALIGRLLGGFIHWAPQVVVQIVGGLLREPVGQRVLRCASLDDVLIWGVLALIWLAGCGFAADWSGCTIWSEPSLPGWR
jgi:FHS family L-fucose permease-like MFS transporter